MKTYIKTLLFALLLMSSITLKAETSSYSNPETEFSPSAPTGDPSVAAPIDDYLFLLLGLGIFMGGYLNINKQIHELTEGDK